MNKEPKIYTVKTEIGRSDLSDLFSCAIEGGSNYWCAKIRPLQADDKRSYTDYMLDGFIVYEDEPSHRDHKGKWTVTTDDIQAALDIMAEKYPRHLADVINENMDAETGDVFLQLCTFKELVYG